MKAAAHAFRLDHWLFIKLMQAIDDELKLAPNQGMGSIAHAIMERYQERFILLQARLIDASTRSQMRYTRLYFDEQIVLMPQSKDEWQYYKHILLKLNLSLKARLSQTPNPSETIDLSFEQQAIEALLKDFNE